jgi:subtilisin-like proprotein convertase family protein
MNADNWSLHEMKTILRRSSTVLLSALVGVGSSAIGAAQCNLATYVLGPGGSLPPVGTGDGSYPGVLPSAPLVSPIAVTLPVGGATVVDAVHLRGLFHPRVADLQFVLEDPTGARHNLLNRLGGFACDYNGDYSLVGWCSCTGYGQLLPASCTGAAVLAPGPYTQDFGTWSSGTHGIINTPVEQIPAANGSWTLYVYDWASGSSGSLGEWEISFKTTTSGNTPPAPPTCCDPEIDAVVSNPVTLDWSSCVAPRATTHKVRLKKGVPTMDSPTHSVSGLTTPRWDSQSTPAIPWLAAGVWYYDVASQENTMIGYGPFPVTPYCRFCVSGALAPTTCVLGGLGGAIPQSGTGDGTWPTILPTAPLVSSYNVVVPAGATQLVKVDLIGATHTWIGDLQFVLTDPTGGRHNLLHRVGHTGAGVGLSCDLSGDYTIAPIETIYCRSWPQTCSSSTILSPGVYDQDFTSWNSGDFGIFNTPIGLIPISSGTWTLEVYDWASGDTGTLTGWQLCFDTGSVPVTYCTAGTTTNGCNASISTTTQPSASLATACFLNVANVEGQKQGLIFYGVNNTGFTPSLWGAGSTSFLCVKSPNQRTGAQLSGGVSNTCSGAFSLDWNTYQLAHPSALGNPFSVGDKVYAQAWFRDPPAPKTTNLSDALELTLQP